MAGDKSQPTLTRLGGVLRSESLDCCGIGAEGQKKGGGWVAPLDHGRGFIYLRPAIRRIAIVIAVAPSAFTAVGCCA